LAIKNIALSTNYQLKNKTTNNTAKKLSSGEDLNNNFYSKIVFSNILFQFDMKQYFYRNQNITEYVDEIIEDIQNKKPESKTFYDILTKIDVKDWPEIHNFLNHNLVNKKTEIKPTDLLKNSFA